MVFGDSMFDFAITSGLGGKTGLEALFFTLTPTAEFGGGESLVATAVSLDELLAGEPSSTGTSASTLSDLILADIDGDGFEDLVLSVDAGPSVNGAVVVLLNGQTPGGTWAGFGAWGSRYSISVGKQPRGLDVGYIDNDEELDVVVANYEDGTVSILINESAVGAVSLNSGAGRAARCRSRSARSR